MKPANSEDKPNPFTKAARAKKPTKIIESDKSDCDIVSDSSSHSDFEVTKPKKKLMNKDPFAAFKKSSSSNVRAGKKKAAVIESDDELYAIE